MKSNIVLAVSGALFGLLLGAGVGSGALAYFRGRPAGSTFESLDDLRAQIVQRDKRDLRSEGGVSLRSIIIPHPSDEIIYTLAPNLSVTFQRVHVRTNSFGFRGPEISVEKPPGVYRIILLGDSFAFGWGVKEEESFAQVLERKLNEKLEQGRRVEVLNFGVPGYSTFQEVALYAERAAQFNPDAALVYFVDNDYGLPFFIRDVQEGEGLANAVRFTKENWGRDSPEIAAQKRHFWRILDPNRALAKLSRLTAAQGVDVFVAINPRENPARDRKRLRVLRRAKRIRTLNLDEDFFRIVRARGYTKSELQLAGDPHPSPLKHALLGELLAEKMLPHLGFP